jgi:hypothetical protein
MRAGVLSDFPVFEFFTSSRLAFSVRRSSTMYKKRTEPDDAIAVVCLNCSFLVFRRVYVLTKY